MTREEAINKWIIPTISATLNGNKCEEILEALEQEPCEDAISRETARRIVDSGRTKKQMIDMMLATPPVTPEPKTGHWIVDSATSSQIGIHGKKTFSYEVHCDKCNYRCDYTTDVKGSLPSNYCPDCGAKMESEGKE